jgi:spore germination protein YaaH
MVAALLITSVVWGATERKTTPKRTPAPKVAFGRDQKKLLAARPLVLGYYIEDSQGLKSLKENSGRITVLAPQSFVLEADGVVRGSVPSQLAALAERNRMPVMPLVVNSDFDRNAVSKILRSPELQERTASYLAYLARSGRFVGWQLDFERIDPADKVQYSAFVKRVAAKLHRDGRLLSVAVTPRFSDSFPDNRDVPYRTGEWGAGFDYRALGAHADFVVLMAYDQHTSGTPPGPVAGYDWVRAALEYATSRIPPGKLVLGIPLYGREWVATPTGQISRSLNYDSVTSLLGRPELEVQWHDAWRTPWVEFRDEPDTHTVWFENRRSFEEKLGLAKEFGLRGLAAWRVGFEDPEFWSVTSEWAIEESRRAKGGLAPKRKPHRGSGASQ